MNICDRIKERRIELGLTQKELANRMGFKTKSSISKAETIEVNPTADRIREFAKALETTPAYLMGWEDSKGNPIRKAPISDEAKEMLELYNQATPEVQRLVRYALGLAEQDT